MSLANLTGEKLKALAKLINKKEAIQAVLSEVNAQIEAVAAGRIPKAPRKRRRKLSAASRAKIAEGQRKRRLRERAAKA